jgi:hypothetical protein
VPPIGGSVDEAIGFSTRMTEITTAENPNVTMPLLNFRGVPTGIDLRKVLQTGILPVITTAITHKEVGVGMIGAGITYPPMECFEKALLSFAARQGLAG